MCREFVIKESLDRVLASFEWKSMFGAVKVTHLDPSKSDHSPIIPSTGGSLPNCRKFCYRFRFEELWANHEDCEAVIRNAWYNPVIEVLIFQVVYKIKATRVALLKWQQVVFKGRQEEITMVRTKLLFSR